MCMGEWCQEGFHVHGLVRVRGESAGADPGGLNPPFWRRF